MPRGTHENSKKNLKQGNPETQFTSGRQAVENGRKGGKASAEKRRTKKTEQEEWAELLNLALKQGKKDKIRSLSDAKNKNLTVSKAMKVKLITEALKGNIKAYECIMRYAGADEEDTSAGEREQQTDNSFINALNARAEDLWKDEADDNTEKDKKE